MSNPAKNTVVLLSRPNPASDLTRVEDYLEVVYELIQKKGYARSADIAGRLGVKSSSVTVMLQKLHAMGLIVYERYRGLILTTSGERLAKSVQQRHLTILKFLRISMLMRKLRRLTRRKSSTTSTRVPWIELLSLSITQLSITLGSMLSKRLSSEKITSLVFN